MTAKQIEVFLMALPAGTMRHTDLAQLISNESQAELAAKDQQIAELVAQRDEAIFSLRAFGYGTVANSIEAKHNEASNGQ